MIRDILNSSGKIIGKITINTHKITINNFSKPILEIVDLNLIKSITNEENQESIKILYDVYTLTIGELAALYNISYARANKWFKQLAQTSKKSGRRNPSFGKVFSNERKYKASNNRKDDRKQRKGCTLTDIQKQKISDTLKIKYSKHLIRTNSEAQKINWKNGIYENVDFGHGIGGYFTSLKINKRFFFRSLLELYYISILETDTSIKTYSYEKIKIPCDNGSFYTPDFIVNNIEVIELKAKKYVMQNDKIYSDFCYKKHQAEKYCASHNLIYKVIFDIDINFDTNKMKKFLQNNQDFIDKYNIVFKDYKRVFGHKK